MPEPASQNAPPWNAEEPHLPTSFGIAGLMKVTAYFAGMFLIVSLIADRVPRLDRGIMLVFTLLWPAVSALYLWVALLWRKRIAAQLGARLYAHCGLESAGHGRLENLILLVVGLAAATGVSLPLADWSEFVRGWPLLFILLPISLSLSLLAGVRLTKAVVRTPQLEFYERAIVSVTGYCNVAPLSAFVYGRVKSWTFKRRTSSPAWGATRPMTTLVMQITGRREPVRVNVPSSALRQIAEILHDRVPRASTDVTDGSKLREPLAARGGVSTLKASPGEPPRPPESAKVNFIFVGGKETSQLPTSFSLAGLLKATVYFACMFLPITLIDDAHSAFDREGMLLLVMLWPAVAGGFLLIGMLWRRRIARQTGRRMYALYGFESTTAGRWENNVRLVATLMLATGISFLLTLRDSGAGMVCPAFLIIPVCLAMSFLAGVRLLRAATHAPALEFFEHAMISYSGYGNLIPLTGYLYSRFASWHFSADVLGSAQRGPELQPMQLLSIVIKGTREVACVRIPAVDVAAVTEILTYFAPFAKQTQPPVAIPPVHIH